MRRKNAPDYMTLTPVLKCDYEVKPDDTVRLLTRRFEYEILNKLGSVFGVSPTVPSDLDRIGSEVVRAIDGMKNVGEICALLKLKLGEEIRPAEQRVTMFLTNLYHSKIVSFLELMKG